MPNFRHGHLVNGQESSTYRSWDTMIQRCTNYKSTNHRYYGGRGITTCKRWDDFRNFLADMGERPEGLTLDRKDSDGNYNLNNCRWATRKEQNANRRSAKPYSCGPNKQRWFRAWQKKTMFQLLSNSQHGFARKHGLDQGSIGRCLRGEQKSCHGWKFQWIEN